MTGAGFLDQRAFESLVSSLLAEGAEGSFGKVHIVSIGPGNDEAHWRRLMPKVIGIAENILHSRLNPDDACLAVQPGHYMLVFPRLSEAEGAIRAAAITQDIREHLFGQGDGGIEVSSQVLPLSRLRARPAAQAAETMDKVLRQNEKQAALTLDVMYQPVWDADAEALVGNRARIRRRFNGQELFEHAVMFGGEQDRMAVEANARLRLAVPAGNGGFFFLPQAINDHAMIDDLSVATDIGGLVARRPKGLVVELAGAVASVARPRLRHTIRAILDAGAEVAIRTIPEVESARFFRDCGVGFLCLNEAQIRAAGLTPSAIYAYFTVIAHDVGNLGFRLCLWNATSPADIKRARALGFCLFSGASIGPTETRVAAPCVWPSGKVYS